jgi:heat shock protein HslJ
MPTDELIDGQLRAAGECWRAAHAEPARIDVGRIAERRVRRRALIAVAAGVVVAAAVVVAVVLIIGQRPPSAPATSAGSSPLVGVEWTITQVRDAGSHVTTPLTGAVVRIDASGQLTGSDGVNGFAGPIQVRGNQLLIGSLAVGAVGSTRPTDAGTIDDILNGTVTWSISGDTLTLTGNAGTITARRAPAQTGTTDPAALRGVTWHLVGIETRRGSAVSDAPQDGSATLRFTGETVAVGDGCTTSVSHASVSAGTLDIAEYLYATKASCETLRQQLMSVLDDRSSWRIDGSELKITQGKTSLIYDKSGSSR